MNIVCVEPLGISQEQFETLRKDFAAQGHNFSYHMDRKEDSPTLVARMKEAEIAVISNIKLPAETLQQCPRLQYLSVAFTGLDHIDLAYCQQHGITVQNAAGYSTTAVSELAIALMLDLLRRITHFDGTIRQGEGRGMFLGRELKGKTVGVVGTGAIGTAVIRLLNAFGCRVLAYNRSQHDEVKALGATYTDLDTLLRQSDIVTIHIPLWPENRDFASAAFFEKMKPGAIFINASRGGIVDEKALLAHRDKLSGVAIDVWKGEPNISLDLLAAADIATPHIAGYTIVGKINGTTASVRNVARVLDIAPLKDFTIEHNYKSYDIDAYDIMADDADLRRDPARFEALRTEYRLRG